MGRCKSMPSKAFEFLKEHYEHNRAASDDPYANQSDDRSVQLVARIIFDDADVETAIETLDEQSCSG